MTSRTTPSLTMQVLETLRNNYLAREMHVSETNIVLNPYHRERVMALTSCNHNPQLGHHLHLVLPDRNTNPGLDLQVLEALGEFHSTTGYSVHRVDNTGIALSPSKVTYTIVPKRGPFSDEDLGIQHPNRMVEIVQQTPPRAPQMFGYVVFF